MKKQLEIINILATFIFVIITFAYFESFGESGILFYLIHTPPLLFLVPPTLFILYQILVLKHFPKLPAIFLLTAFAYLLFFAARSPNLNTTRILDETAKNHLRVCSWNSAYFFQWGRDAGFTKLKNADCDVVLLQEVWDSGNEKQTIEQYRNQYLPNYAAFSSGEFVIFARKEFVAVSTESKHGGYFSLSTLINQKKLNIMSIHLWNPITSKPVDIEGKVENIPAKIARSDQKNEILNKVQTLLDQKDEITLIAGDFNTMENGKILRDILATKSDANALNYLSLPLWKNRATYSTNLRLIAIDHVFITKGQYPTSRLQTSCEVKASDHCLLIVDLML